MKQHDSIYEMIIDIRERLVRIETLVEKKDNDHSLRYPAIVAFICTFVSAAVSYFVSNHN